MATMGDWGVSLVNANNRHISFISSIRLRRNTL
jgi:hypothetical protein